MPFIYKYQVDGNGDYVLDGGNKVILESYQYGEGAGLDWRRIASSTKKPPYIRSFAVRSLNNGDAWVLIINQKQLVGIYPSQDAALQILNGLFTRVSANDEAAREAMSHQLSKGGSSINAAGNDVIDIRLFTDEARTNNVTSNPPGNTLLYAYAYSNVNNPDSSPIINATYFEGQGVVASFSGTPTPSEVNAADGTVLSVTDVGVAGTDTPTVTYAWSTSATTPTLDTTGLEGTAITCTVTASNQWTPDATAFVDFGTVAAPPSGPVLLQEAVYSYDATGTEISYTTTGPKEVVYNNAAQITPPRWMFGPTLQTDHPTLFDQYLNDRYYAVDAAAALAFCNLYDLVFTCEYNDGTTYTYTIPGTYYTSSVSPPQLFYNNLDDFSADFANARTPATGQTSTVTIQVYNVGEAP